MVVKFQLIGTLAGTAVRPCQGHCRIGLGSIAGGDRVLIPVVIKDNHPAAAAGRIDHHTAGCGNSWQAIQRRLEGRRIDIKSQGRGCIRSKLEDQLVRSSIIRQYLNFRAAGSAVLAGGSDLALHRDDLGGDDRWLVPISIKRDSPGICRWAGDRHATQRLEREQSVQCILHIGCARAVHDRIGLLRTEAEDEIILTAIGKALHGRAGGGAMGGRCYQSPARDRDGINGQFGPGRGKGYLPAVDMVACHQDAIQADPGQGAQG